MKDLEKAVEKRDKQEAQILSIVREYDRIMGPNRTDFIVLDPELDEVIRTDPKGWN